MAQDYVTVSLASAHVLRHCVGLGPQVHAGGAHPAPSEIDLAIDGWPQVSEAYWPRSFFNCCFQTPEALFLWTPLSYLGPALATF